MSGLPLDFQNLFIFFMSAALGLSINFWYGFNKQEWAASEHQRYVSLLLPPAVLTMTWVIASNLALSLGMIGALSIVRFRNPVKSPFELATYFIYIVIGVSAGVAYNYALLIWALAMIAPLIIKIVNILNNALNVKEQGENPKFIVHLKLDCGFEDFMDSIKGNEKAILSMGRDTANDNMISLSLIVRDTQEYADIKKGIEKCARIVSEDMQVSA